MIIYGDKGLIGSTLKGMDYAYKLNNENIAYLWGRSDGNTFEEFYRQVICLNDFEHKDSRIVYASTIYVDYVENYYTLTKKYFERYFNSLNATGLRFCGIYGPGGKGIINKLIKAGIDNTSINISNKYTVREFMYVDDAARWVGDAFVEKEKIIEAGSGQICTLGRLVEIIEDVLNTRLKVTYGCSNDPEILPCTRRMKNATTIYDGIKKTYEKIRSTIDKQ